MKKLIKIFLLINVFILSSCGGFKETFNFHSAKKKAGIVRIPQFDDEKGTLNWVHYDATKRGSMIYIDQNGNVRILAENPPDAAIQSITEITTKLGEVNGVGSIEAALNTQRSIAELGKRTAAVNMMRDALYRLNEMYYSSVDRKNNIMKKREEFLTKNNFHPKKQDEAFLYIEKIYPINKELNIDSNDDFLKSLFESILDKTKEIAVQEAKAEIEISKYKREQDISKARIIEIENFMEVFNNVKDSLSTEEKKKYLDMILQ